MAFKIAESRAARQPHVIYHSEFAGHYLDDVRLTLARRPLLP